MEPPRPRYSVEGEGVDPMGSPRLVDQVFRYGSDGASAQRPALASAGGRLISYGQLAECARDEIEHHSGLECVVASPGIEFVQTYLRFSFHGIPQLLVPERLTPEAFQRLLRAYKPAAVNGDAAELARLGLPGEPVKPSDGLARVTLSGFASVDQRVSGQVLLLTSGSTGAPRSVRLSPQNIASNTSDIVQALEISADDVAITTLPLSYSYGLSVLQTHLWVGALTICERTDPMMSGFRELLEHRSVTSIAGVPFSYAMFDRIGLIDKPPPTLTKFTQAGGRMDPQLVLSIAKRLDDHRAGIAVMYGQTEATARISVLPPHLAQERPDSVGYALASGSLAIGSANHGDEIVYRGPNVMLGYAEAVADLSRGDEQGGTLETGDLGSLDDGLLRISGRIKRIAKLSGVRVNLDYIEQRLRSLGELAVTADGDRIVVGFVESEACTSQAIAQRLTREIGILPRDFRLVAMHHLPRLDSGKLAYQELIDGAKRP